jgi:hypothetical protein
MIGRLVQFYALYSTNGVLGPIFSGVFLLLYDNITVLLIILVVIGSLASVSFLLLRCAVPVLVTPHAMLRK